MTLDFERTDKLNSFKQDAAKRDIITCAARCVNRSEVGFAIDGDEVFYALSAIRNVGTPGHARPWSRSATPTARSRMCLISRAARQA
jgi:DNA polymerase III alpha subunit